MKFAFVSLVEVVFVALLPGCTHLPGTANAPTAHEPTALKDTEVQSFRIETPKLADAFVKNRLEVLQSMLHPSADPYFGKRAPGPTCDDGNRPPVRTLTVLDRSTVTTVHLFATAQHVFGACNEKLDTLKSQIAWAYCFDTRTLYEAKHFYPATSAWLVEPVISCP